jgi:hypothetical protein
MCAIAGISLEDGIEANSEHATAESFEEKMTTAAFALHSAGVVTRHDSPPYRRERRRPDFRRNRCASAYRVCWMAFGSADMVLEMVRL